MDKQSLGSRIREARLKKGVSQRSLSQEAGIGEMYLSEIERGLKMPSMNIFIKIIDTLDVSADYILRDELTSGEPYLNGEVSEKLRDLTPRQKRGAMEILDAYIRNL